MIIRPYLIVPKLIPQPTWGGSYIAKFKGLQNFEALIIGQSYELATDSKLSTVIRSTLLPVEIGDASTGATQETVGDINTAFSLQAMIDEDAPGVLGKRVAEKSKNRMQVLIKFTQAKGNSFQVHVRKGFEFGGWKPKPESWYFFEPGKVTLGLKQSMNVDDYKLTCLAIEAKSIEISQRVIHHELSADAGRKELADFVWTHSPYQYVNEMMVPAEALVDLSEGGIHHSWEEGSELPNGNIIYEVQANVMDKECTLRSFDKGKIADDGSIRPIHVQDYFQALDTDAERNARMLWVHTPVFHSEESVNSAKLFSALEYESTLISFSKECRSNLTTTDPNESFHHLFVKGGNIECQTRAGVLTAMRGSSILIPANTGEYVLRCSGAAQVIRTSA